MTRSVPLFSGQWDFDSLFRRMCRPTVEIAGRADASFETGRMFMPEYRMRPEERERYGDRRTMFLRLLDDGLDRKVPEPGGNAIGNGWTRKSISLNRPTMWTISGAVGYGAGGAPERHRNWYRSRFRRGSLVSYLFGITSIDPLKYDLIFSRFSCRNAAGSAGKTN